MRVFIFLAAFFSPNFVLADGYDEIAQGLSQYSEKLPSKKVALVPFAWADGKTDIGSNVVSERLTTRIVRLGKLEVVERAFLDKVLAEQKLQVTGLISSESAKELGKILGVDAIVTGSLIEVAGMVEINARVILAETGEVLGAQYARVPKDWGEPEMAYKEALFGLYLGPRFGTIENTEVTREGVTTRYKNFPETKSLGASLRYTRWESRLLGFAVDLGYSSVGNSSAEVTEETVVGGATTSNKVTLPKNRFHVSGINITGLMYIRKPGKTIQPYLGFGPAIRILKIKPSVFDKEVSKTLGGGSFAIGFRVVQPGAKIRYAFELMGTGSGPINYEGTVNSVKQTEQVMFNAGGLSLGVNLNF